MTASTALVLLLGLWLLITLNPASAATLTVCSSGCSYTTIQAAIDAAGDGDIILVSNEIFNEDLVITKSLSLLGGYYGLPSDTTSRTPRLTTINSPDTGPAIMVARQGAAPLQVTVDGFEVTGAIAPHSGVYVNVYGGSHVVINDNLIDNNSCSGIVAEAEDRSTLQITNNDVVTNTTTGSYGGIHADTSLSTTLVITGNTIRGNSASGYGGLYARAIGFGEFQIEDNVVMSNTATTSANDDYGGLYFNTEDNSTGTFNRNQAIGNQTNRNYNSYIGVQDNSSSEFYDNLFRDNQVGLSGTGDYGGVYINLDTFSYLTGDNLVVANNTAEDYGGVYINVDDLSALDLPNIKIKDNKATNRYGGGRITSENNNHISIPNLYLFDNAAINNYGGLYIDVEGGDVITATGMQVISNTTGSTYGGIRLNVDYDVNIDLSNSRFISNTAANGYAGGNFDISYSSQVTLANSTFISNTSETYGGAAGVTINYNSRLDLSDTYFERNIARTEEGGALYVEDIADRSTLLLTNAEFLTNTSGSSGGGLYVENGPHYISYLDISHTRFVSNTAATNGGGFYVTEIAYNFPNQPSIQADHMEFTRNTAGGNGGAVYFGMAYYESGQLIFDNGVYKNNKAASNGGAVSLRRCSEGCELSLSHSTFENNEATGDNGGALHIVDTYYSTDVALDDNAFTQNTAGGQGGAIYYNQCYDGCTLSMSNNTFDKNTANNDGGAVYLYQLYNGTQATVNNNQFRDNKAGGTGGAFYNNTFAQYGTGSFDHNTITGNTAGGRGGAFYSYYFAYDGDATFNENHIASNQSVGDGGGVYFDYLSYEGSNTELNNNTIQNNIAINGDGAGVCAEYIGSGSQLWFQDNLITGNVISGTGSQSGGGIYLYYMGYGDTIWMTGNIITGNVTPNGYGGGLYMDDYLEGGETLYFENNTLSNNYAGRDGGGCYFEDYWEYGNIIHFNNNQVNNNAAQDEYGGCYIYDIYESEATFINNQFNGNSAGADGGGLYIDDIEYSKVAFRENTFTGNRAGITETTIVSAQVVYTTPVILGGDYGGLVLADIDGGSQVDFYNNLILSNTAYLTGTTGGNYGGMAIESDDYSLIEMQDNTVAHNTAQHSHAGIHATIEGGARIVITRNKIRANHAITGGTGILITGKDNSQYYLEQNRITDNTTGAQGCGIALINTDNNKPLWGYSTNNLVADNSGGTLKNAGFYIEDFNFYSINDTIANNVDYGIMVTGTLTSTVHLSNTIIWGHDESFTATYPTTQTMRADYSDIQGGWPGDNNLDTDPLFVGSGDYHLQTTSPVINNADATVAPARDLDNIPRPVGAGVDMGAYELHLAGVTLQGDGTLSGDPGTWVVHTLSITNTGDAEDEFSLQLSNHSWTTTLSPDSVILAAGTGTTVEVRVYVPDTVNAGDRDTVDIDAVSTRNALVVDSYSVETQADLVPGVMVSPDNRATANAGSTQIYQHIVKNLGNGPDTFALAATSSQGWTVQVSPASVSLGQGLTATVEVRVSVPTDDGGQIDSTTFTATSQSDNSATDSATDTTTAVNSAAITLEPDRSAIVVPGASYVYTHTLTNDAAAADTIVLSTISSSGWPVEILPTSVYLEPGLSTTVYVTVTTPAAGGNPDITTLTATSGNVPNVKATVNDLTMLNNPGNITLEPNNSASALVNTHQVYTHTLTNNSSAADTLVLNANSNQGWAVELSPATVDLNAGASTEVVVTVTVPASGTNGLVDVTLIQVSSTSAGSAVAADVTTLLNPASIQLSGNQTKIATPGSQVVYNHTLTNLGARTDTFALAVTSSVGWTAQLGQNAVTLEPGQSAQITMQLTVPAGAAVGTTDQTTLTATSAYSTEAHASNISATTVDTTANKLYLPLIQGAFLN